MAIKIKCINKDNGNHNNPHEAITHYGWIEDGTNKSGKTERQTMVNWVKDGVFAYVSDNYGRKVKCECRTSINGLEFLQTVSDGRPSNNLLQLIECL